MIELPAGVAPSKPAVVHHPTHSANAVITITPVVTGGKS